MSFEGFYRVLCKNGHLDSFDVYVNEPCNWKCSICQEKCAWEETIDQTNGYEEGSEFPLEIDIPAKLSEPCKECGSTKLLEQERYKIPTQQEVETYRNKFFKELGEKERQNE